VNWSKAAEDLFEIAGDEWLSPPLEDRIESVSNLYVACSGGSDSVFLALFFSHWRKRIGKSLVALHFNHRLRGDESDRDEAFCADLCAGLGIEFKSGRWEANQGASSPKRVSEDEARRARMAFFAKAIDAREGLVLTGHHADDLGETFLMRLSRGSGLQGLTAPREVSKGLNGLVFGRPLLGLRKSEIVGWLERAGAVWREDASNQTDDYYRNRLRRHVLPEWEKATDRPLVERLAQSRALLEEDWRALDESFERVWRRISVPGDALTLSWGRLLEAPPAFQRRAIARILIDNGCSPLSFAAMTGVLEALRRNRPVRASINEEAWLLGDPEKGVLGIASKAAQANWSPFRLPLGTIASLPGGGRINAQEVEMNDDFKKRIMSGEVSHRDRVFLDAGAQQMGGLRVRLWNAGDSYRPMGRKSPVKLKELFSDRKISKESRHSLPIIVDSDDEILWVPGLPPNESQRIGPRTSRALQLTYQI
jgi:tRNA(Ile)-lysidine synthase